MRLARYAWEYAGGGHEASADVREICLCAVSDAPAAAPTSMPALACAPPATPTSDAASSDSLPVSVRGGGEGGRTEGEGGQGRAAATEPQSAAAMGTPPADAAASCSAEAREDDSVKKSIWTGALRMLSPQTPQTPPVAAPSGGGKSTPLASDHLGLAPSIPSSVMPMPARTAGGPPQPTPSPPQAPSAVPVLILKRRL